MVNEIRIYVEGGGDLGKRKNEFRKGFSDFFSLLKSAARKKRLQWRIVVCGARTEAFKDFDLALQDHPDAFNVLLVDSESAVTGNPLEYLRSEKGWMVRDVDEEHCHLMVQMMEAWLVADKAALVQYYDQGFNCKAIPGNPNVEEIEKTDLEKSLKEATKNTRKGEYHKTRHAAHLLGMVDVSMVRRAAPYCDRLFRTLQAKINTA